MSKAIEAVLRADDRIMDRLENENALLRAAFEAAERICKDALPKFDWGKSALDAKAIQALNEGMLTIEQTRRALNSSA